MHLDSEILFCCLKGYLGDGTMNLYKIVFRIGNVWKNPKRLQVA